MKNKVSLSVLMLFSILFSMTSAAEKLTVVFGEKLAPWVLADTDEGIIIDILKATLTPLGYEIQPLYMPYARRTHAYKYGNVDAVSDMNLNTINQHNLKGYFSDNAYAYENFAFSLHKNKFNFTQIEDLKNHSLLSWQDAAIHLGEAYAKMVNSHDSYSETFDQLVQVKMLYLDKFDVVQMDANIFDYYRVQIINDGKINATQQVDRFGLFGESPNGFLFKSEALRNKFNTQLLRIKKSGEYQKIFDRYLTVGNTGTEKIKN
jgi:polar amino acid transport system substrate-binding protein